MHPLIGDLTGLTDIQLTEKIIDINKRLSVASRYMSYEVAMQLRMIMENYQHEQMRRNDKMMKDLVEKNPNFKNIINIQ